MSMPIEEFELSGLIDGELDPVRAAEVRQAMEQDAALRNRFEQLVAASSAWAAAAESVRFEPAIHLNKVPGVPHRSPLKITAVLCALLAAGRMLLKGSTLQLSANLLIQALMLGAVLALVVWLWGSEAKAANESVGV